MQTHTLNGKKWGMDKWERERERKETANDQFNAKYLGMNGIPVVSLSIRCSLAERNPLGWQECHDWQENNIGLFELDKVQAAV